MEADGYGGIFDGAGAAAPAAYSCSIPFLDIPPSSHCSDSQIIDYSEIFGGSNGAGYFALFDYEELIRVSKKKAEESSDSSNARISTEAKLSPQFEETSLFPEEASQNLGDHSMKNNSSPSSNHNNDASKKIRMSYHRLSHDSREDIISEKTHLTQLQAIPGYSHVIDSCSSLANVQHDNSVQIQTSDLIHRVSSDGRLNNAELGKEELHTSFTDNTKSYKDDMNTNQKDFKTKLKHHSRSSSSYSTSSVDFSDPSVTYVSAYDINLRTKPSNIPPPSRAPPKLYTKQDNTEMKTSRSSNGDQEGNTLKPVPNQIHYRVGVSKSGRFFRDAKDTTSRFFDADEDASSAAAAMKEAMEQAQANLRSAKELMEREQNNLQSRKKLGHEETIEYNEMEIQTSEKGKIFHDEITKKSLLKNRKGKKKYALDDTKNVMTTEEKERYVVTTEESQPLREGNGFKSCHRPYKSEELYREQKTEKQYYELANNEKFRVVKEAFKHGGVQRKPKTARDFGDDRLEGNENVERSDDNSIAGNITLKEDIVEIPNSFLGTCFVKENVNKLEEDHSFNQQYKNEKVKADQEVLFSEQKLKAQYSSENMSMWGVKQKNDEFSGDALKLEEIYQDNKENGNSQVAEEACLHAVSAKKLSGTNLTFLSESEEKSNVNLLDNHQSSYKQNECKLEGTVSASEQKESRKLDGESMQVEKNLGSNLPQDENEMKESSEITKKMKSTQETWPDYAETIEAIWERLQNKEKVNASKVLSVKKNTAKPIDSEDRESKEGNEALCTPQTFVPDVHKTERVEKEGTIGVDREFEKETARKIEEEKERKREREKDRATVEKAPHEAHECALSEAREKFERIAVERGTAEVQQRALAEKLKEAKLRAECAAVERELAEARERAVKKALDEIAAADAWKRAEKLSATSREKGRKENESGDFFRACLGEVTETRLKAGPSDVLHDAKFLNAGSSSSSQRHADSYPHGEVESPLRFKARLERRQRTSDRAAKALAEKNMHDVLVQREQAERNRFAESLDGEIRRWATGKEGNLRALLSTLQYILGPESGWQPIPLTDVITAAAVKKAYRKATLCVHPDKLQQRGANIQQKYICEKVFDLLKDAWSQFNSEER